MDMCISARAPWWASSTSDVCDSYISAWDLLFPYWLSAGHAHGTARPARRGALDSHSVRLTVSRQHYMNFAANCALGAVISDVTKNQEG